MADPFSALQSSLAVLETIKMVRQVYVGVRSVNRDVQELFMDIDSLSSAIESIHNCLSDPALARADQKALTNGPSIFTPLISCFGNCNHTVDRLKEVMSNFNPNEDLRLKRVWKFAKFKHKGEDLQAIRQQLSTQLASLNTSFSALQLQRGLQSDERDQQAYADLQRHQMELRENLEDLSSKKHDVQATIQSNPDSMEEGAKVLQDAEDIRKSSMHIQKRVIAELQRRVSNRHAGESVTAPLTVDSATTTPRKVEDGTSPLQARPVRKPLISSKPTFDIPEEPEEQAPSMRPLQRTHTEPMYKIESPPPLFHSITSPGGPPQLVNSATNDRDASRTNVQISFEEFETAFTNAIADAEARKRGPNKPFGDEDFDLLATLLRQVGRPAWAERPRTYLVLRMIGETALMNNFVFEGCKDIHFPYSENRLPTALTSSTSKQSFLSMQYLVLSQKSIDLVQGGPHRHLGRSADTSFTIIRQLGRGGQGAVDHIRCKLSLKEFARKRLQRQKVFSKDKEAVMAFENEIRNLKRLSHRHLVRFVGSYTDPKYVGIIMEPVADTDLRRYLMRPDFPTSDFANLRSFLGCLTSAMLYLHSNNCRHKDIKPGNILIKNDQVLITDFGIAHDWTDLDHDTTSGNPIAYTNAYAAPEVARARPRNMSADVWSMGCVFLDILTVLEGSSLEQQRKYFENEGNFSSAAWDNRIALEAWIDMLENRSGEHTKPIKWIRQMTAEDPTARPTAKSLLEEILIDSQEYCGTCCSEDAESPASEDDSYCGSETDDEGVFTTQSDPSTRGPLVFSPLQAQSPTERSLTGDSTTNTSVYITRTGDINVKELESSLADATLDNTSASFPLQADTHNNTELDSVVSPSWSSGLQSSPWHPGAELPSSPSNRPSQTEELTTRSQDSDKYCSPRSESFPTDTHRNSQQSITVRDPEGNEIRKSFKKAFATDLPKLEALVLEVSPRRDDWHDLLLQAVRPQDSTTNRYTILHPLTKFEDETMACEVLKHYINEGAEIDARDFASSTPLQHAAYRGKVHLVQLLLGAGAKCAYTNFRSQSALILACIQKNAQVTQVLIKQMSNDELNIKDASGWTALHHACASGNSSIVKILLEAGANALAMDKASCPPFWRCDASITQEISHFYRTWRATLPVPDSRELQDVTALSSWNTCDLWTLQSDTGVLKGQRAATKAREPGSCPCASCNIVNLAKRLSDAGSMPAMACACSRHLQEMTENILGNVATVKACIDICSCKTCTKARRDCGKQSTAPEPVPICQCSECSSESNVTWLVPGLASCDHYKGHEHYDDEIEKAIPKLCSCTECHAVKYSNAVRVLADKGFKGKLSYRSEPRFAWTNYIEEWLELAREGRKRQVSSEIRDVVDVLLGCRANINSTKDNFTMLHAAVMAGNVALANLLIDNKADLDAEARDGETALMMALMNQDSRMLRLLLRSGAKIDSPSSTRRGPYQTTKRSTILSRTFALYGQLGWMAPMILAHKPQIDVHDDLDRTPLQWAVFHQRIIGVQLLIEAKCSLEKSTTKYPKPLFMAIDQRSAEIVRLLADSGAELHATEYTSSALHRAAAVGHVGALNVLMERPESRDDLHVKDTAGCTPLHYLAQVKNEEVTAVGDAMIAAGASISAEDAKGNTPLHSAAKAGSLVMAQLLVRAAAVTEAQNHAGKTPSDLANAEQHKEIVEFLGGKFKKKWLNLDRTEPYKMPRADTFKIDGAKLDGVLKTLKRSSRGDPSK